MGKVNLKQNKPAKSFMAVTAVKPSSINMDFAKKAINAMTDRVPFKGTGGISPSTSIKKGKSLKMPAVASNNSSLRSGSMKFGIKTN